MPIKFIIDGHFRSGTTMLWEIVKESNEDLLVFYEPLNGSLLKEIDKNVFHPIHKKHLYDEYRSLPPNIMIMLADGYRKYQQAKDYETLIAYLNVFHSLNSDVVLQTNRLGPFLTDLCKVYDLRFFFIIRNLDDVTQSKVNYFNEILKVKVKGIKKKLKLFYSEKIKKFPRFSNAFGGYQLIDFMFRYFKEPKEWSNENYRRKVKSNPLFVHIVNWVLYNKLTLEHINSLDGQVLLYEEIIKNPENLSKIFQDRKLIIKNDIIKRQNLSESIYYNSSFEKEIRELQLEEEYSTILRMIKEVK